MRRLSPFALLSALLLAGCGTAEAPDASPDQVEAAVRSAELELAKVEQDRKQAPSPGEPASASEPRPD
jgi:outer membrane murein-binding lipoprotein Lpp